MVRVHPRPQPKKAIMAGKNKKQALSRTIGTKTYPNYKGERKNRAVGAGVAHYFDIVGVTGSNPVLPTFQPIKRQKRFTEHAF